jgi:hypothetical protein
MATDPVGLYEHARMACERAGFEANRLAEAVCDAGKKLNQWKLVEVSGIGLTFPHNHTSVIIDGNGPWPTIEMLGKALHDWHRAREAAEAAYLAVPPGQRAGLEPPPR